MRNALLFLAVLMFAQSQPPSPSLRKETKSEQENSASQKQQIQPNNNQPHPNPVTVNQYNSQPDSRDKSQTNAEQYEHAFIERLNAVSTGLLALFTLILAAATGALCIVASLQWRTMKEHKTEFEAIATAMSSGLAETTKAANAAKQSADALINSERAWVVIDADPRFDPIPGVNHVRFWIWNTGKTPAKLTLTRSDAHVLPADTPFPVIPPYTHSNNGTPYNHILAPGRPDFTAIGVTGCLVFGISLARFDLQSIQKGNESFYMFGRVDYETFGMQKYTTFGFRWKPPSSQNPFPLWDRQELPQSYNENT